MAQGNTLRIDKGSRCSVLVGILCPTREVTQRILNPSPCQCMTNLVAVRPKNISCGGLTYEAIFFTIPFFPDLGLHAAKRFTVVTHDGHANRVWDTPLQADGTAAPAIPANEGQEINTNIFNTTNIMENITCICAEGFEVDDNNEALPENVPVPGATTVEVRADGLYQGQTWGWDGIDKRASAGAGYKDMMFKNSWSPHNKTYLEIFTHFLPYKWLETIMSPKISVELETANSPLLTLSELMQFIGMRLLMSMLQGWTSNEYWYYNPFPRPQEDTPCPYNFKLVMAKRQFLSITRWLIFTDILPPFYCLAGQADDQGLE
jgi:hypothetical protein